MATEYDDAATLEGFKRICKVVGNLRTNEIGKLVKEFQKRVTTKNEKGIFQADYDTMYDIFTSNPVAKKICEKNGYRNWEEVVTRYYWVVDDYRKRGLLQDYLGVELTKSYLCGYLSDLYGAIEGPGLRGETTWLRFVTFAIA